MAKRSEHKATAGGRKTALRRHRATGTATEEVIVSRGRPELGEHDRLLQVPLMRGGEPIDDGSLDDARERLAAAQMACARIGMVTGMGLAGALKTVPWEGLKLSRGEPALPTTLVGGPA